MSRNVRRVQITLDFLAALLTAGAPYKIVHGLPADARIWVASDPPKSWMYDPQYQLIDILVESDTFDSVQEGDVIPLYELKVVYQSSEVPA